MTWRPAPSPEDREPRPVASSLAGVSRRLGAADPRVLGPVFAHWEDLVGPALGGHTEPLSLRDGVLTVGVDLPAWATQVRYLGPTLMERITATTGRSDVVEVRVRVLGEEAARRRAPGASRGHRPGSGSTG